NGSLTNAHPQYILQFLALNNGLLQFSAASLHKYATNPLAYFFQYILKIRGSEKHELNIAGINRGNLIHRILEKFYKQLKAPIQQEDEKALWRLMQRVCEEEILRTPFSNAAREAELFRLIGYRSEKPQGVMGGYL